MTSTPDRAPLTDVLIGALETVVEFVGDVIAPQDAGWQNFPGGNDSVFVPYVVLTPQASPAPTGSLGDSQVDWRLPYTLTTYGVTRQQIEDVADEARRAVLGLTNVVVSMHDGTTAWKIIGVTSQNIGGVGYTDQIKPTAYSQSDSVLVWFSKKL
jgi:hypothetical protein